MLGGRAAVTRSYNVFHVKRETLGDFLREIYEANRDRWKDQTALAADAGLTAAQMNKLLNDKLNIEYETLERTISRLRLDDWDRAFKGWQETKRLIYAERGEVGPKAIRATSELRQTARRGSPPKR